jgi:hypothetical protein
MGVHAVHMDRHQFAHMSHLHDTQNLIKTTQDNLRLLEQQLREGRLAEAQREHLRLEMETGRARLLELNRRMAQTHDGNNPDRLPVRDGALTEADALIDDCTSWWGNLDEEKLGERLAASIEHDPDPVTAVLSVLRDSDKNEVAGFLADRLGSHQLEKLGESPEGIAAALSIAAAVDLQRSRGDQQRLEKVIQGFSPIHRELAGEPWTNDPSLQRTLKAGGAVLQGLRGAGAAGHVAYDRYSVTVTLPNEQAAQALITEMLNDLNGTVDSKVFDVTNVFSRRDTSTPPRVGDLVDINIVGIDNGAVALVDMKPDRFIYAAVTEPVNGRHPEWGSRAFGYENNGGGTFTFYTQGVHRADSLVHFVTSTGIPEAVQGASWEALVDGIGRAVKRRGGEADDVTWWRTRH